MPSTFFVGLFAQATETPKLLVTRHIEQHTTEVVREVALWCPQWWDVRMRHHAICRRDHFHIGSATRGSTAGSSTFKSNLTSGTITGGGSPPREEYELVFELSRDTNAYCGK